jgi:hypothetical protein
MAQGHLINIPKLGLRMVEPICKELEIETETKMAKWLRQLLFQHNSFAGKSFIVMYLNQPRTVPIHVPTDRSS